jgi:thiol-disulfide isomerase/thioredoxin
MNLTGIILVSVVIFSIVAGFVLRNEYKKRKKQELVDSVTNSPDTVTKQCEMIYFYTTWCPYCKRARPEWDAFKEEWSNKKINGYLITFTEVDCDINETTANKYDVKSYPTIKLIKEGQVYDFDARPTSDSLTQFAITMLN